MSEHSNLFYLKLEQMSAKHFEKQSGYELWHRRLGHAYFRNIRDTIKCAIGLESFKHMTCDTHVKCPSCLIGKATLEDLPKAKKVMIKPLYQIHMDSFSPSVKAYPYRNFPLFYRNFSQILPKFYANTPMYARIF